MITPGRHRPLAQDDWNESAVRVMIEEIAADAIAHFNPDTLWPAHPNDDGVGDGDPSFYKGAAGVVWALDYLRRIGATGVTEDFRSVLPKLMERTVIDHDAIRRPTMRSMVRSFAEIWARHFSQCALSQHRVSPTWSIGALKQTMDCQSESSCGVCRGRWSRPSTWAR